MASKILMRAKRFATTSDRQREKLQAQINVYALRHHADKDIELQSQYLRTAADRLSEPTHVGFQRLNSWIENTIAVVDRVLATA
jgi:hypothetical protein